MVKEKKFYSLTFDTTFKYMFKDPKFKEWFSEIIMDKFGINLMNYELIDAELNTGNDIRDYRLDNLLEDKNNSYCVVEMQTYKADVKNCMYIFRLTGNSIKTNQSYKEMKQVILIQFDSYSIPNISKPVLHFSYREDELDIVKPGPEIYEFILPNFDKRSYNEIDRRLALFMCKSYEEMRTIETSESSKEVIKELELLGMDDKFDLMYSEEAARRLTEMELKEDGIKEGFKQGKKARDKEIIEHLIKKGKTLEEISNLLDMPISDLKIILEEPKI